MKSFSEERGKYCAWLVLYNGKVEGWSDYACSSCLCYSIGNGRTPLLLQSSYVRVNFDECLEGLLAGRLPTCNLEFTEADRFTDKLYVTCLIGLPNHRADWTLFRAMFTLSVSATLLHNPVLTSPVHLSKTRTTPQHPASPTWQTALGGLVRTGHPQPSGTVSQQSRTHP